MFFAKRPNLPIVITSYDIIKCVAVLIMFIDHLGAFFMPGELWIRVIGRLSFPIWFFLAGFSGGKKISTDIWIGAGLLIAGSAIFGEYMMPASALVSFICIRVFMSHHYKNYLANGEILLYVTFAMVLMAYPTNYLFEYGTLAFLFAMFGYAARNKDVIGIGRKTRIAFCAVVAIAAAIVQNVTFKFNALQSIACLVGMGILCSWLFMFKQDMYPTLTDKLPKPLVKIIQFGGRYTLEIYVFHLLVIKAYMFFADTEGRHQFLMPTMFPPHM